MLPSAGRQAMRRRRQRRARILITSRFAMAAASPGRLSRDNNIKIPTTRAHLARARQPSPKGIIVVIITAAAASEIITIFRRRKIAQKINVYIPWSSTLFAFHFIFFFRSVKRKKEKKIPLTLFLYSRACVYACSAYYIRIRTHIDAVVFTRAHLAPYKMLHVGGRGAFYACTRPSVRPFAFFD